MTAAFNEWAQNDDNDNTQKIMIKRMTKNTNYKIDNDVDDDNVDDYNDDDDLY